MISSLTFIVIGKESGVPTLIYYKRHIMHEGDKYMQVEARTRKQKIPFVTIKTGKG
jgi:hypothetical protein